MQRYEEIDTVPTTTNGTESAKTRVLIGDVTRKVVLLAQKEIELARAELASDLRSSIRTLVGLAVAAVAALAGLTLLLVAVVLALAAYMPGWVAALLVAGVVLVAGGVTGSIAWSRRVRTPMALTIKTVKEDVRWVKERLA